MAATIQTIEKPTRARALDTSGNNNHGQIYSGRALEFDGATDYLTYTSTGNLEEFTAVGWMNCYGDTGDIQNIWDGNAASTYPCIYSDEKISWYAPVVNWLQTGKVIDFNTWYRVVFVFKRNGSGGDYRVYINGIEDTGGDFPATGVGTYTEGHFDGIGSVSQGNSRFFNGMMSDMQVWNTSWTADDVAFDYANPEQLALNRGGTSLTNSNLKIWYPMNDGHRGQQSYILDASNTGLGDEMTTNGDLSSGDLTGWTHHGTYQFDTVEYDNGSIHVVSNGTDEGGGYQSVINTVNTPLIEGVTYKISYDITVNSGSMRINVMNGPVANQVGYSVTHSSTESVTSYFVANSNSGSTTATHGVEIYTPIGTAADINLDNVSLKPVNNKNHATTVFHGDELINDEKNRIIGTSPDWTGGTVNGSNTNNDFATYDEASTSGATEGDYFTDNYIKVISDDDASNKQWAYLDGSEFETNMVVGRQYRLQFSHQVTFTKGLLVVGFGTAAGVIDSYARILAAGNLSATTRTIDFTYKGTTTHARLMIQADVNTVVTSYIDNFTLKEIGTATGWTDADQQLDIPQTALQSYNQLAWFDGYASDTAAELDSTFYFEVGQTINMWVFPNSITIYDSIFGARETENYVRYQKNSGSFVSTNELVQFEPENNTAYSITATSGGTLEIGKWEMYTFIWNADRTIDFYINGEKKGASTATADTTDGKRLKVGHFGAGYGTSSLPFEGAMTEISHYTDILTESEINDLYNDSKAKSALEASGSGGLSLYLRNNGLAEWKDLKGSNDANVDSTETMLITAGADGSRDSQGFLMNRQRATNSLNLSYCLHVDSYTDLGSIRTIPAGDAFSLTLWINPSQVVNNKFIGASNTDYIRIRGTSTIRFYANSTSHDLSLNSGSWVANEWVHISIVRNTSNLATLYINGSAQTDTETINEDFLYRYIGSVDPASYTFDGAMDDVCIYGDELTAAEVKRNYNAGKRSHR